MATRLKERRVDVYISPEVQAMTASIKANKLAIAELKKHFPEEDYGDPDGKK